MYRLFIGVDFSSQDLSKSMFKQANLMFANLSNAYLRDAQFIYSDLSHANISRADISYTNFERANLSYANFSGAKFWAPNFEKCNLSGANLSGADFSNSSKCESCLFNGANMTDTIIKGFDISLANFTDAFYIENNEKKIITLEYLKSKEATWNPNRPPKRRN